MPMLAPVGASKQTHDQAMVKVRNDQDMLLANAVCGSSLLIS